VQAQHTIAFDSLNDPCKFGFEKAIGRKLYFHTDVIPDKIEIYLDDQIIPFKRSGKYVVVNLPAYKDSLKLNQLKFYASKGSVSCKEFMFPERTSGLIKEVEPTVEVSIQQKPDTLIRRDTIVIENVMAPPVAIPVEQNEKQKSGLPSWIHIYLDTYYAYYTDSLAIGEFQKLASISPQSNVFGLNTAAIDFEYTAERVRGFAGIHYGDFSRSTWTDPFNNIMEAHAGLRIAENFWIDAGLFKTHLGTEGLLPKENICSSIAMATYFEPALISGIRFNYQPSASWMINLYLLNGYNGFVDNNSKKSLGSLITYSVNDHLNFGISNYFGDDTPEIADSISHLRFHQNMFCNYQWNKLKMQLGLDYCQQQHSSLQNENASAAMLSGLATLEYLFTDRFAVYSRYEFFNDPDGFMSGPFENKIGSLTGYKLWGITAGIEYKPIANMYIRMEGRQLQLDEDQPIFFWNGKNTNTRYELQMNAGIFF
jgi:hypothetical protein